MELDTGRGGEDAICRFDCGDEVGTDTESEDTRLTPRRGGGGEGEE